MCNYIFSYRLKMHYNFSSSTNLSIVYLCFNYKVNIEDLDYNLVFL